MSKKCGKCQKELDIKRFITEQHQKPYACCNDCRLKLFSKKNKCETCGIQANFNFEGEKDGKFCSKHRDPIMIDVRNKSCQVEKCTKRPCFNIEGEKRGIFCAIHKKDGMIDVKHKKCQVEKCDKRPSYNKDGEKEPIFCKLHKKDDMVDVVSKVCESDGCKKKPSFNLEGKQRPKFCSLHKKDGMIDVVHKRCLAIGCEKYPSYDVKGGKGTYCAEHRLDGMIDIKNSTCQQDGCTKLPNFNFKDQKEPIYCLTHRIDGMIDVKHKKCQEENCVKRPNFNTEGEKNPLFCFDHKKDGMVDITHTKCKEKGCRKRTTYGFPLTSLTHCADHKKDGMTKNTKKTCETDECKEMAVYGVQEPVHCEEHSLEDEYNLIEHPCIKCKKIDVLNKEGFCVNFCSLEERDRIMKKKVKKHEEFVNNLLDEEIDIVPFSKDTSPDRECTSKRPDRVYHLGTHVVIVEIDEDQHKSYKCTAYGDTKEGKMKAEKNRMYEISQGYDFLPCIWLRYNPDHFKVDGKPVTFSTSKRHELLVKWVKKCVRDTLTKGIKVKYLFYDDFDETDASFENIE